MFFKVFIILVYFTNSIYSNGNFTEIKCLNETSFSINICGKPPLLNDTSLNEKMEFCSKAFVYINCLDVSLSMVCDEFKGNSSTIKQFQNLIKIVNKTYRMNDCDKINSTINLNETLIDSINETKIYNTTNQGSIQSMLRTEIIAITLPTTINDEMIITDKKKTVTIKSRILDLSEQTEETISTLNNFYTFQITPTQASESTTSIESTTTTENVLTLNSECKEFENHMTCQSLALHRTCGYPAANPNKNLNAFCKELIHYIRCAKCRILACADDINVVSVQKHIIIQEANYDTKCLFKITTTSIDTSKPTTLNSYLKTKIKHTNPKTVSTTSTTTRSTVKNLKPTRIRSSTIYGKMNKLATTLDIKTIDEILKGNISNSYREFLSETKAALQFNKQTTPHKPTIIETENNKSTKDLHIFASFVNLNKTFKYTNQPTENTFVISTPNEYEDFNKDSNSKTINELHNPSNIDPMLSKNYLNTRKSMMNVANNIIEQPETTEHTTIRIPTADEFDFSNLDEKSLEFLKNLTLEATTSNVPDKANEPSISEGPKKLNQLSISFDHINVRNNTSKVLSSLSDLTFDLNIVNRTDIFKGVRNGAIYLHSKTYFTLNLNEHIETFCITSASSKNKLKNFRQQNIKMIESINNNDSCEQGWTVSFWIKVSNFNLFDKTIIRVDTFSNKPLKQYNTNSMKYLIIRISNFDIRAQFLYKKKLWTLTQNVIWKSEWSQLSITWHEFEGITVYINERKIICQQHFEFYNHKEDKNKMSSFNFGDSMNEFLAFQNFFTKSISFFDSETNSSSSLINANNYNVQSLIYIGLNNKAKSVNRKMYWMNREDQNNILLTTAYAEAILIDELLIYNYRLNSKQILELYLKEYSVKSEYDSVQEVMHLASTDSKQSEILLINGANAKKFKDNWFINLNGNKQFSLFTSLLDSCLADAENLCYFGVSITLWIKFNYNFLQFPIHDTFEQSLLYMGSNNFQTGLEAFFSIVSMSGIDSRTPIYNYVLTVNLKTEKYTISKHFKIFLKNINQLEQLNCLTIQFPGLPNINTNIRLHWLNVNYEEIESSVTAKMIESGPTYPMHIPSDFNEYDVKTSVFTSSNSIGLLGDINKQSYFNIQNIELHNYDVPFDYIENEFLSANPTIYELNSIEKLFEIQNINIIGNPQIVETRYGKSFLFSKPDQKVIVNNVSNSCFGNLNLCDKGYTLKVWFCSTNFNTINSQQQTLIDSNNLIHIIGNGGHKLNSHGISIMYDIKNSRILAFAKTYSRWYKISADFKIKLYNWYIITMSFDLHDGLRLYINNRLMDHRPSFDFTETLAENLKIRIHSNEFIIGNINVGDIPEVTVNNNSYTSEERQYVKKRNQNSQYEFIIHKIVHYNIRKYPDEIVSKNVVIHEKKPLILSPSMSWLWYTIGCTFLVIGVIALLLAFIILKRRNNINGSWSRDNDREEYYKKNLKTFCCTSEITFEETVEKPKVEISQPKLELKQCQKMESFRKNDEFSESLFGTIDRLLSSQEQQNRISNSPNDSSAACTSASLYKEVRKSSEDITSKQYPPMSLTIIKKDSDKKKSEF